MTRSELTIKVLAVCFLLGLTACGAAGAPNDTEVVRAVSAPLVKAPTTVTSNWDPVCGDVAVRTRGTNAPITLYVSPTGKKTNDGRTVATAVSSLADAQEKVTDLAHFDYTIIVKGGTYYGQSVLWTKVDPNAHIHIKAADGETPVFDGFASASATMSIQRWFFNLQPDPDILGKTNVTIEGMTAKHYVQYGIALIGQCTRIYNNKLLENGDLYADCYDEPILASGDKVYMLKAPGLDCDGNMGMCCNKSPKPGEKVDSNCRCTGFGAIDTSGVQHSLFKHNDIVDFRAGHTKPDLLHVFYLARMDTTGSTNNIIEDNFGSKCDGSGMKFRDGSGDNTVRSNYLERVNGACFSAMNAPSLHNAATRNVCTFSTREKLVPFSPVSATSTSVSATSPPFYLGTLTGAHPNETGTPDPTQYTTDYMQTVNDPGGGTFDVEELVTASAAADLNGDGKPEVFVALHYPALGYSKVVYSDGGGKNLRTVAYTSDGWKVTALAAIRPPAGAPIEVAGAFYNASLDATQIWTGKRASDGRYDLNGGTKLYDGSGASAWKVNAMTAGKFGSDASDVLVTAAVVSGVQEIWRGDGRSAQSGSSRPGVAVTKLYSNANWRVTAMTNGVVSGAVNSLITAYHWVGNSNALNAIYTGDGVGGASTTQILASSPKPVSAMTFGRFGGSTARLVSSFDNGTVSEVYVWTGATIGASPIYSNASWRVTSLATAQIDAIANDQLVTSLDFGPRTRVDWGDGTTGVTNGGSLYAFP